MKIAAICAAAASAALLSACGGSSSGGDENVGGPDTAAYIVTVNTSVSGETTSTTQEVAEGESLDIEVTVPENTGVLSSQGCGGQLTQEGGQTLYRLATVTQDCAVDIVLEQKPDAFKATSEPTLVTLEWESALDVDLLWSTDPNCDWQNYASCENSGAQMEMPAGEGLWQSSVADLEIAKSYYFVLRSDVGYSSVVAGQALFYAAPSTDHALMVDDKLYVASNGYIGSGHSLAQYDIESGKLSGALPYVNGTVDAVVVDGDGWIIAGSFSAVANVPRENIARISRQGVLDKEWSFSVNGRIQFLEVVGERLVLVGEFSEIDGFSREGLALINLATGQLPSIADNEGFNARLGWRDVSLSGETLYLASATTQEDGKPDYSTMSALNIASGEWLWHEEVTGTVLAASANNEGVFYSHVFREGFRELSRVRFFTVAGELTDWQPELTHNSFIFDLAVDGEILYAFDMPGRIVPMYPKAFSLATADQVEWNLPEYEKAGFFSETEQGLLVYGDFANGEDERRGAFNISQNELVDIPALEVGSINDLAFADGQVLLAGSLSFFLESSSGLQVYNSTTGYYESSIGVAPLGSINDMVEYDGIVYIASQAGGSKLVEGSDPAEYIPAHNYSRTLRLSDGSESDSDWPFETDASIYALELVGDTLYVAGAFTSVNGESRSGLAAYNLTTKSLLEWSPEVEGNVTNLTSFENVLYVGGDFTQLSGEDRNGLGQFNITTGVLTDFVVDENAMSSMSINAMSAREHLLVVAGDSTSGESVYFVRPENGEIVNQGIHETNIRGSVEVLLLDGIDLYLGGHMYDRKSQVGCCQNLFKFDIDAWAIEDFGLYPNGQVEDIVINGNNLYLFGLFNYINGSRHNPVLSVDKNTGEINW